MATVKVTLRLLRQALKKSLNDVAEEVGVSASAVRRWELGMDDPSTREAERYAEALGVTQREVNRLIGAMHGDASEADGAVAPDADDAEPAV